MTAFQPSRTNHSAAASITEVRAAQQGGGNNRRTILKLISDLILQRIDVNGKRIVSPRSRAL
jgi:hypothetical protein